MARTPLFPWCAALGVALLLAGCEPRQTQADLEGDWVESLTTMEVAVGISARAFSFRGDSVLPIWPPESRWWHRYRLHDGTLSFGDKGFLAMFSGDTLVLTPLAPHARPLRLVRLPPGPEVPRPERIAFSGGYCFGSCPNFDLEIDSAGTVRYEGYDHVRRRGRYDGTGRRGLYERLSGLAAAARADTARVINGRTSDAYRVVFVLWYAGRPRVHSGSETDFGDLRPLIMEIIHAAEVVPLDSAQTLYRFKSRALLEEDFGIPLPLRPT